MYIDTYIYVCVCLFYIYINIHIYMYICLCASPHALVHKSHSSLFRVLTQLPKNDSRVRKIQGLIQASNSRVLILKAPARRTPNLLKQIFGCAQCPAKPLFAAPGPGPNHARWLPEEVKQLLAMLLGALSGLLTRSLKLSYLSSNPAEGG